jgi:hypothetical protein
MVVVLTLGCGNEPEGAPDVAGASGARSSNDAALAAHDGSSVSMDAASLSDASPSAMDAVAPALDVEEASVLDAPAVVTDAGNPAAALDGFRWEIPCKGSTFVVDPPYCDWDPKFFSQDYQVPVDFRGAPGVTYDVTLRVRGVIEARTYLGDDGQVVPQVTQAPYFLVGGKPDPKHNDFNDYYISVASPKQIYYLNAFHETGADIIYKVDYEATIRVDAGSRIILGGHDDASQSEVDNYAKLVVPDIPPAPAPFNGQFIQLDVVSTSIVRPQ